MIQTSTVFFHCALLLSYRFVCLLLGTFASAHPAGRSNMTCCITVLVVQQRAGAPVITQHHSVVRLCHYCKKPFYLSTGRHKALLYCMDWY